VIRFALLVLLCLAEGVVATAQGADWQFGGHLKYQYTVTDYRDDDANALLGENPAQDQNLDFRAKAEGRTGAWDGQAHYEILGTHGDSLPVRRQLSALGVPFSTATGLPDDSRRLFDLTSEITDRDRTTAVQRLDRLSIGHTTAESVVRIGRQAVSWGNGLVFYPLDFVNPFSPIAIDKDYKTGDDMIYSQWVTGARSDMQAIAVARRDPATGTVETEQATFAAKVHARVRAADVDLLVAGHFGETLAGAGIAHGIGGAMWRLDVLVADLETGGTATSLVTNVDYSWTWFGRNFYGYAEYFRNGVGHSDPSQYLLPDPELTARLERGELFTIARDYLSLGGQIELTPLFNLFGNLIGNLDDGSIYFQLRGAYDWQQDLTLIAGVNLPHGERGDEYGGIPVPGTSAFLAPGRSVYLRGVFYF
jgi:hypothetical protein